ncbi:MAG: hypothetical protein MK108_13700 [Mariniblastus sp.]|nr:hypothetical protein [Mariniblastus sp.]
MNATTDLSPWAHPKSQAWFEMLFKRSGMLDELERFVAQPLEQIEVPECRMVLMLLIILARPGIWPSGYDDVLVLAEQKVTEIVKQTQSKTNRKMTMAQHQQHGVLMDEIRYELEVLRRRIGKSSLKTRIHRPATWKDFWA